MAKENYVPFENISTLHPCAGPSSRIVEVPLIKWPIYDPERRQIEWFSGMRPGEFDPRDVRVREDMRLEKSNAVRWIILPCPRDALLIRGRSLRNARATVSAERESVNEIRSADKAFYEYAFYAPEMDIPLFCTYEDGTYERFDSPYRDFPLVLSTALPTHVIEGMRYDIFFVMATPCLGCALKDVRLVAGIQKIWSQSFPRKFLWGRARKSLLHPRSEDSYCYSDDDRSDRVSEDISSSQASVGSYIIPLCAAGSSSSSTADADAAFTFDVDRVVAWRRQVAASTVEAMPELEAMPSSSEVDAHTSFYYRITRQPRLGLSSDIDTSVNTSNDWAYRKYGVSLWLSDGARARKQPVEVSYEDKYVCLRLVKSTTQARGHRTPATTALPNERVLDFPASSKSIHRLGRALDCQSAVPAFGEVLTRARNVASVLPEKKKVHPLAHFLVVHVIPKKRRCHSEEPGQVEWPRNRFNCH
ncbi:hypothetical protein FISHEDRAFT_69643 [Fistulina hepatica ATCC 64428]|uniref:Uncharacterized protein n=1 Tax=Fistulina hepatica ATCC 64428 TaxID=1128425 RepID=A0A0D7AM27_9AGAR|nr:hypothetical protein FISHEDRAFT_69643 [Fistulina hepatica ATCC 64428]